MKKICLALMCIAGLAMVVACGGGSKSGGSAASGESASASGGLEDAKWPAAVYGKYGFTELPTKGKIVFTDFSGEDNSYQYRIDYRGVTREELLAWVNGLKEKGFRLEDRDYERLNKSEWNHDIMVYQPEEGKDMRLRISFDFKNDMEFDYWTDEPNPAFTYEEGGAEGEEHPIVKYNLELSLNPIKNVAEYEGSNDALGLKADDLKGIPNVRAVKMSGDIMGGSVGIGFYADHQLTAEDFDAVHGKVADVLEAKGAKFTHALSGKDYTAEQLKADKIRTYGVAKGDAKFMMMSMSDDRVGDFGGAITFRFVKSNK